MLARFSTLIAADIDAIYNEISTGTLDFKHNARTGKSASPAPTLSTIFFAKAGTCTSFFSLLEYMLAPSFPCVIAIYFTLIN